MHFSYSTKSGLKQGLFYKIKSCSLIGNSKMSNILRFFKSTLNYKNLLFLICVLGLTLQTIELFDDFMQGKTLPNLFLGQIDNDNFPAITICPSYVDYRKISTIHNQILKSYDSYLELVKSLTKTVENDMKEMIMNKLYTTSVSYYFQSQPSCNVEECILNKMTSLIDNKIIGKNQSMISPFLGRLYYDEKIHQDIIDKMLRKPQEIITISPSLSNYIVARKCLTYFSHFQTFWQNIRITRHEGFLFHVKFDNLVYPYSHLTPILFSIHSPNSLPTSDDMITVI